MQQSSQPLVFGLDSPACGLEVLFQPGDEEVWCTKQPGHFNTTLWLMPHHLSTSVGWVDMVILYIIISAALLTKLKWWYGAHMNFNFMSSYAHWRERKKERKKKACINYKFFLAIQHIARESPWQLLSWQNIAYQTVRNNKKIFHCIGIKSHDKINKHFQIAWHM